MSQMEKLALAQESWRRRRGGSRTTQRASLGMEHLDHRQLLSVTFTGNVTTDFIDTNPDVVIVRPASGDPRFSIPVIEEPIRDLVRVSGFQLDAIRLVYDSQFDTLQIGIEQPDNQKTNQRVIAGDIDNNLNGGDVDPTVLSLVDDPDNYIDFPSLGGTETMLTFFRFDPQSSTNAPDIIAGIDAARNDPAALKSYQVAKFNVNANPDIPGSGPISPFGELLAGNTGSSLLGVTPDSPGFEYTINNFADLYEELTGNTFQLPLTIEVGAFAGSANDGGTSEAFIPATQVTIPVPQTPSGPQSPQVLINPHNQQHVNTFVNARIRVYILGTSGFDVSQINPSSVRLGGAAPVFTRIQSVNSDQFPDRVFVFNSRDVDLPRGPQDAVVSGQLLDGTAFMSAARVYNQPGFFTPASNDNTPVPLKRLPAQRTQSTRRQQPQAQPAQPSVQAQPKQTKSAPPVQRTATHRLQTPNPGRNRPHFAVADSNSDQPATAPAPSGQIVSSLGSDLDTDLATLGQFGSR